MLRYLTSGESHGPELTTLIDGAPSGLELTSGRIDFDLKRRQDGYGRGQRMKIESDSVRIISGVRHGRTLGSPICLVVSNRDWENWTSIMGAGVGAVTDDGRVVTRPRPGHADLPGGLKYGHRDLRNILERSSARETAARVAAGAVAKALLERFGIRVMSWVVSIGDVKWRPDKGLRPADLFKAAEASATRCPDKKASEDMMAAIDRAKADGDSLGGVVEVVATGVPPGLGSHVQWDRKLDARLALCLMSIQAIKGVEAGLGFKTASLPGSKVHDEIFYMKAANGVKGAYWPNVPRFFRRTNNAGGIEGGMSNGEPIAFRIAMKPIPTLYKPLRSVDIETKKPFKASVERSDVCAVPAAGVVAEAVMAFELATAFLEKFGSDSIVELERNYTGYLKQLSGY